MAKISRVLKFHKINFFEILHEMFHESFIKYLILIVNKKIYNI